MDQGAGSGFRVQGVGREFKERAEGGVSEPNAQTTQINPNPKGPACVERTWHI